MSKPEPIRRIEALLKTELHPAPVFAFDPWVGLLQTRYGRPKYQLDSQGRLTGLNLTQTGLTDAQWASLAAMPDLRDLRVLKLEENALTEFRLPPSLMGLERLYLDENPLTFPAPELMAQGMDAVLRFLKQAQTQGVREVYEVKLLIVGEGGAGKTTLWNLLQNPDYPVPLPPDRQPSTVGIQIKEGWSFPHPHDPQHTFLVNLWDFGGQEIQYMTHQFFLTRRSFYVLLAEGRRGAANFAYWFKIIEVLGADKDSARRLPVLAVLNEKGVSNPGIPYDQATVATDYPRLEVKLHPVDFAAKGDYRLEGLYREIKNWLADPNRFPHLPLKIPTTWDAVRTRLMQMAQNQGNPDGKHYIRRHEYQQVCQDAGLTDPLAMDDLSQLLHDLGNILHYQDDDFLREYVVLNPQWAVGGVYAVLEHGEVSENQGRFDKAFLTKVLVGKGLNDEERRLITRLMLKDGFEVCFKAEETGGEIFIAPQLLPQQREPYAWPTTVAPLRYVYQYPFMPKGLIGRLIVRLHEQIESNQGRKVVWETGMVLADGLGVRALVEETVQRDTGGKVIRIEVIGNDQEGRRFLLRKIREQLDGIHQRSFRTLKFSQIVPCCCSRCATEQDPFFFDVANLERGRAQNVQRVQCQRSFEQVSIDGLLRGIDEGGMRSGERQLSRIKEMVARDQLREALEDIRQALDPGEEDQATQLLGRLTRLEREQIALGDTPEINTQRNALRRDVLSLLGTLS